MSVMPAIEPADSASSTSAIAAIIDARVRNLAGFKIRRLLPSRGRRLVGPFVFFDHMGPVELEPGEGLDVPPHPHIGLATVTYLFDGKLVHRDSLGSFQPIKPGDINWMAAGRGIVHSERTGPEERRLGAKLHGLQLWVALPKVNEEMYPAFHHYDADALPKIEETGAHMRVLAGAAYGSESQVQALSPLFCIDVAMEPESEVRIPNQYEERAAYVIEGVIRCDTEHAGPGRMLVFTPHMDIALRAEAAARIVLIGGAPIDGQRHIWWNFVSSSQERIERAKQDWKEGRFPKIPGDEAEFARLPE